MYFLETLLYLEIVPITNGADTISFVKGSLVMPNGLYDGNLFVSLVYMNPKREFLPLYTNLIEP